MSFLPKVEHKTLVLEKAADEKLSDFNQKLKMALNFNSKKV
jgi:hypothetical protein